MKTNHRKWIGLGYLIIFILIGIIGYSWYCEWDEVEKLEVQNRQIDEFRKKINNIYIQFTEFSLLGETVLDWNEEDLGHYHAQRMAMDSMLFCFRTMYPAERIDSVRHLLEDKERQMCLIVQVLDEQQKLNEKIARQVPVIVQKSVQEQPQKPKRKGFLGIFGKKEKPKPTATTTMLRSLNRNIVAEQQTQSRCMSEHANTAADSVGTERRSDMTWKEADNKNTNPNFKPNTTTADNCQACVVVHKARLRGIDVTALPYSENNDAFVKLGDNFEIAWISPKTKKRLNQWNTEKAVLSRW